MTSSIELQFDSQCELGEGPVWDEKMGRFFWIDILQKQIHLYDVQTKNRRTISLNQHIGALALVEKSDALLLALQHGFYTLDLQLEKLTKIADPEEYLVNNRFNDGKCDPAGRFWAGTTSLTGDNNAGALYCLDIDLRVRKMLDNVSISNGLAWSPDYKTMYFIDSPTREIAAFDYDIDTGEIRNRRIVVSILEIETVPDGMTIDEEGMIWVAQWDGYQVSRFNPKTGERLETISVPVAKVTSCTFGGYDLNELWITTARTGLDNEELKNQFHAGGVFKANTKTKGFRIDRFGGQV